MNNDELKKKIEDILEEYNFETDDGEGWVLSTDEMADDLIAAGLTFDKTMAVFAERANSKTLIQKAQYYDQMKHRAEVAERALRNKCEAEADNTCPYDEKSKKCKECTEKRLCSTEYATQCFFELAIKQAEKELAEERKDD